MEKTPEELIALQGAAVGDVEEVRAVSAEDIADAEEAESMSDAFTEADRREERIELRNDSIDTLVDETQEVSDEGIDSDDHQRG
jgi:N utilization substance protein A